MNLQDAFELFLARDGIREATHRKYYYRLRPFISDQPKSKPETVTQATIAEYINKQDHLADASKSILRQAFNAFFNFCKKNEWIDQNPAATLPRWSEEPRYIHVPKEREVRDAIDTAISMCEHGDIFDIRDGLVFMLAVYSGCRRDEIRNLDLGDLDRALRNPNGESYRAYTKGKTGEAILRFSEFHVPFIEKYLTDRPNFGSTAVFVNLQPTHVKYGTKLSLTAFNRIRWKICDRAQVPSITYQELRRRLATIIARSENVDVAAHALNHSPHSGDRVIRLFYYDPDSEKVDQATAKVFNGIGL